jgi:hypothetical protein
LDLGERSFTHQMEGDLALRIYSDRRPGNLEIAGIHKAIVLLRGGVEVVEEGAGFGLPVAKYEDKTFFPGSATLTILPGSPPVAVKTYGMDTISVKSLGGSRISDSIYQPMHGVFSRLYLGLGSLRPAFDAVIELRNTVGLRTSFETAEKRGEVEVRYTFHQDRVEIEAKTRLREGCEELVFLNEQGASTFRRYSEGGKTLTDGRIGAWNRIDMGEATLSDLDERLAFTVIRPGGAGFWRGREKVKGRLSWAGLALSFSDPGEIRYTVMISANKSRC